MGGRFSFSSTAVSCLVLVFEKLAGKKIIQIYLYIRQYKLPMKTNEAFSNCILRGAR